MTALLSAADRDVISQVDYTVMFFVDADFSLFFPNKKLWVKLNNLSIESDKAMSRCLS